MTDWVNINYNNTEHYSSRDAQHTRYKFNGILHRLDGPAHEIIFTSPYESKHEVYYFAGEETTKHFVKTMVAINKRLLALEAQQHNIVIYESFIEALKNAMDDSHTDDVTVSRKLIEAIRERTLKPPTS